MKEIIIKDLSSFKQIWEQSIKPMILRGIEGGPVSVQIGRPNKTRLQEKKYHSMIRDICATATIKINGAFVDLSNPQIVKALLISWYEYELNEMGETLKKPSVNVFDLIRCELITVRASSKEFTAKEAAGFIEFLYKTGAEYGARWSEEVLNYDEYPEFNRAEQSS